MIQPTPNLDNNGDPAIVSFAPGRSRPGAASQIYRNTVYSPHSNKEFCQNNMAQQSQQCQAPPPSINHGNILPIQGQQNYCNYASNPYSANTQFS